MIQTINDHLGEYTNFNTNYQYLDKDIIRGKYHDAGNNICSLSIKDLLRRKEKRCIDSQILIQYD